MATNLLQTSQPSPDARFLLPALEDVRARTLALVRNLSDEQLEHVHSPIMSPLVWDLGHIAAYEDLWLAHRQAGLELLRPDLAELYDAFETPRAVRGQIDALGPAAARDYLQAVRARSVELISDARARDANICEMVVRHELQHSETMRQTLAIAGLLSSADQGRADEPLAGLDGSPAWLQVPAGEFAMGSGAAGFAYDNERPRHTVELAAFEIARRPVSSGSWMEFSEAGGYERPQWWSQEGWAWKQEHRIGPHPAIAASNPRAPACHVSWYEAEAYAAAHQARLPSEAEWERAATVPGPAVGAEPARGQARMLEAVGRVWEWTRSFFGGYPGFVAHPYREYSEVFFGDRYRVLRGGSWATDARVANPRFRNWDLPQRRQIFAGLRLARAA
jgi:gamma-glutamyl hercynylcysteine S-oxide synthase